MYKTLIKDIHRITNLIVNGDFNRISYNTTYTYESLAIHAINFHKYGKRKL